MLKEKKAGRNASLDGRGKACSFGGGRRLFTVLGFKKDPYQRKHLRPEKKTINRWKERPDSARSTWVRRGLFIDKGE